jgi:hypothetical protein
MGEEHERAAADWPETEILQRAVQTKLAATCKSLADTFQESAGVHEAWAADLQPQEKSAGASSLAALLEE